MLGAQPARAYLAATSGVEIVVTSLGGNLWEMTLESDRPLTDGAFGLNQGFASMAYTTAAPCDGVVAICNAFDESLTGRPFLIFSFSILNPTDPTVFTGVGNPVVLGQLTTTGPLTIGVNPPEWGFSFPWCLGCSGGFNMGSAPLTFVVLGCSVADGEPGSEDFDEDLICDADDSCPTVVNAGTDQDGDGIDNACDTCPVVANPVNLTPIGGAARTLVSGQLDDDADGFGNRCDWDYDQEGFLISPADFAEMVATVDPSRFPNVGTSTCGLSGTLNCGIFDHDGAGLLVSPADFSSDVAKAQEVCIALNGPSCGAACTPPLSGPIGSGFEILGKAICDGPAC